MSDHDLELVPLLPDTERETLVLRYWRRGDLTPLQLANALAGQTWSIRSSRRRRVGCASALSFATPSWLLTSGYVATMAFCPARCSPEPLAS